MQSWIIGTSLECDIVVNESTVSSQHCRLTHTKNGLYFLEDLGSTNGTFLNGERINQRVDVPAGERVTLGSNILMPWPVIAEESARPRVVTEQALICGRDADCDQVLDHPMISRRHVRLVPTTEGLQVEDLGSTNGTYLNGKRILEPALARTGDVIELGTYAFTLSADGQIERKDTRGHMQLEARNISVDVPSQRLLENISLTIRPGEFVGMMGPSGAGKSTLINILAGLVLKTSGEARIWNFNIERQMRQARRAIGVVPQEPNIDPFFTPRELLDLQAGLYGIPKAERRSDEVLQAVGLSDKAHAYARSLSGGMRRRLLVAKAMVHSPQVLVLDEPSRLSIQPFPLSVHPATGIITGAHIKGC